MESRNYPKIKTCCHLFQKECYSPQAPKEAHVLIHGICELLCEYGKGEIKVIDGIRNTSQLT